jgi:Spy/CpxP family protein refolding chaperone
MKSIRTTFYLACLTAALGGASLSAAATQPAPVTDAPDHAYASMRHGGPGSPDGSMRRVLDQLDLTAQQKTQMRAIFDQARPQLQAVRESGRANRDQLDVTPPTDPAYAGLLTFAKSNAAEQVQLMSDLWTQVYAKLTPDQRARIPGIVAAERAERDARRASRHKERAAN